MVVQQIKRFIGACTGAFRSEPMTGGSRFVLRPMTPPQNSGRGIQLRSTEPGRVENLQQGGFWTQCQLKDGSLEREICALVGGSGIGGGLLWRNFTPWIR